MINWGKIAAHISEASGSPFSIARLTPIPGGYTNQAWHLEGVSARKRATDTQYFIKLNSADNSAMFAAETLGLTTLAATHTLRVPQVLCQGIAGQHAYLVLEYLELHRNGNNKLLAFQLAALHRVQAAQFGWDQDNTLALTTQHNTWSPDWLSFWREQRLGFQLDLAARNGFRGSVQELGKQVMDALPGLFAGYSPAASLLHGDLWGGNYGFLADGTPVIFDPAPYYGDREADLAMTELFGGFEQDFYASYQADFPLDAGYAKRKTLYNLYHILNHCNLVGSSYLSQAEGMMRSLLQGEN